MKIWCQLPIRMPREAYEGYYRLLEKDYSLAKRPDTEVLIQDVPDGLANPELITYLGLRFYNDRYILERMLEAQEEGYDGIAGACYFDGAIEAARQLLEIPVVGAAESAMLTACLMGRRFGTVTSDPRWTFEMERHIHELGLEKRAVTERPVRSLSMPGERFLACLGGDYEPAIEDFSAVARTLIEDGADTIIAGCGLLSPMLTVGGVREIDGVPIVDPMLTSLKITELLIDFRHAGLPIKSTRSLFLACESEIAKEVLGSKG